MLLNFLVNFYLLIPVWLIKLICIFNKDIKREYIFDPQSKLLIYLFPKLELQNVKNDEIKNLRSAIDKRRTNLRISKKPKKEIKKVDHYLDKDESILLREYSPYKVDNKNIILFFHGGGYVLNSVFTHDDMVAYFSEKLRTRIFSLDYKLAPENKFPAALENAIQAFEWLEDKNIPYSGVPVGTIKKHVTGKGNANKQAIINAVRGLGFDPRDDNEADALALLDLITKKYQ